jgi:hypothetical protein
MSMSDHLKKKKSLSNAMTEIMSPVGNMASGETSDRLVRPNSAKMEFSRKKQSATAKKPEGQQGLTKKRVEAQQVAVARKMESARLPRVSQAEKQKLGGVKQPD